MARIYYFAYPTPSTGGDFLNVAHVTTLQYLGYPAHMVYPGPAALHPGLPADSMPMNATPFRAEDYFVIPENDAPLIEAASGLPCRQVLHNQNTFYFLNALRELGRGLDPAQFDTAMCVSRVSADMMIEAGYRGQVTVIHPALPDYFRPGKKTLSIAFSPRKLPMESGAVIGAFRMMYPEYRDIAFTPIANLPRSEVAKVLSGAAIYAAFSDLESLSLSILEAMQSGCIVVGDHGGGGAEYARPDNGLWVRASKVTQFARALAEAVEKFRREGEASALATQARATAAQFNSQQFTAALDAFWSQRVARV